MPTDRMFMHGPTGCDHALLPLRVRAASGVAWTFEETPQDRASLRSMTLRPDEFYDNALAAADGERRLPLARMTGWDISPFEPDGLRVAALRPPILPEPARHGENPAHCHACRARDEGIWLDDRWRLTRITNVGVPLVLMLHPRDHHDLADLPDELAAELGILTTHIVRHVQALPNISRAHVYRIGAAPRTCTSGSSPGPRGKPSSTDHGWSSGTTCYRSTPRMWPRRTRR